MSNAQIIRQLAEWIRSFAIDPYDAAELSAELDGQGIDKESFADYLDGAGYPNLAAELTGSAA